jgi:hypothetical protein
MSRSRKKNPHFTQGEGGKHRKTAKRYANKAIRNKPDTEEIGSGAKFKREFNSWDICDWKFQSDNPKAKRK